MIWEFWNLGVFRLLQWSAITWGHQQKRQALVLKLEAYVGVLKLYCYLLPSLPSPYTYLHFSGCILSLLNLGSTLDFIWKSQRRWDLQSYWICTLYSLFPWLRLFITEGKRNSFYYHPKDKKFCISWLGIRKKIVPRIVPIRWKDIFLSGFHFQVNKY